MSRQGRQSAAFASPAAGYAPHTSNYPNAGAQEPLRDCGPPQPPRTYPTHIGPPAPPSYATPRTFSKINWDVARHLLTNQRVQVRIDGHGWVLGLTLTCLKFFDKIAGMGCQVRYTLPGDQSREEVFRQADVQAF